MIVTMLSLRARRCIKASWQSLRQDKILHRQLVGLMHGAVFGSDVVAWKQIAIKIVDYEKG
jgi:hypothetical protein